MNETRQLAEFIVSTSYQDLPKDVVHAVRVYILDNLASGLIGSKTLWANMVTELALENSSTGPCTVLGSEHTVSPSMAALVNGTMIGSFETDHAFFEGSSHPSAAVFPSVVAIAERDGLDGTTMLTSIALGYEVICRVGLAATRAVEDDAGFHGPGTNAPFGGAAGAGKALGLDVNQIQNAFGIAASHACGLLEFAKEGAMTKRIHVGRGAQTGLESALLAQKGFTGPSKALEGERGFLNVFSPSPRIELLTDGLGKRYTSLGMTVKAYACHASFHAVIDGISRAKIRHGIVPDEVDDVFVAGTDRMMEPRFLDKQPISVLGAQYSLPFSIAVALCHDVRDPTVYSESILGDPLVRKVASQVQTYVDSERFGGSDKPVANVKINTKGGQYSFDATDWKGSPKNPYSYSEMTDKFRRYASSSLSVERIQEVVDRVECIEEESNVSTLLTLVRN